jgi:hypothetical protein
MSLETKTKKLDQLSSMAKTMASTKNGKLSILITRVRVHLRDSMKISDSKSADHSTSDQDSQCKESSKVLVPTTW